MRITAIKYTTKEVALILLARFRLPRRTIRAAKCPAQIFDVYDATKALKRYWCGGRWAGSVAVRGSRERNLRCGPQGRQRGRLATRPFSSESLLRLSRHRLQRSARSLQCRVCREEYPVREYLLLEYGAASVANSLQVLDRSFVGRSQACPWWMKSYQDKG